MARLQTIVQVDKPGFDIKYPDRILFIGSCFSDNIGQKLVRLKFNAQVNPFGVLYNPASVSQAIDLLVSKEKFEDCELDYYNELWYSFSHHTTFSKPDKNDCLKDINASFGAAKDHLSKIDHVFITLGTSWAFRSNKTGNIVANCHKIPAKEFAREYLEPKMSVEILSSAIEKVKSLNPNVKFVLTVSPIRHWKDGAVENMRSKAALLLAIKQLEQCFSNVYYFPVFEIFMDELRDYRFYSSDMLHPSEFAVEYLWERFIDTFFNSHTRGLIKRVDKIKKSLEHRPINTSTKSYLNFVGSIKAATANLSEEYPFLDFTEDMRRFV